MAPNPSFANDLKPLTDEVLMEIYTNMAIKNFKDKLDPTTARATISTLHRHYPTVTFPFTPEDLCGYINQVKLQPSIGTRTVHARYIRYYLAAHLAYYSLRHTLGTDPDTFPESYYLMPRISGHLRPLNRYLSDVRDDDEERREMKEKTTLPFSSVIAAREKARLATLTDRKQPLKNLNAYIILMLATYGPPPRSSEIARIQVYSTNPPQVGNTIFPTPTGCTLILRIHKNSHRVGSSSDAVTIDYPSIVWEEIQRVRTLIPDKYLSNYLLSGTRPPITKKQINNATSTYLVIPDSIKTSRYAYTNRDLRQAYALANLDLDPSKLMHTERTHKIDYLPPFQDSWI